MKTKTMISIIGILTLGFSLSLEVRAGNAISIFDGKTLNGWEGDTNNWRVEDGSIVAGWIERKQPHNDFLATRREFGNFELRLQYKVEGTNGFVNGGVQFWSQRVPNNFEVSGYQADLGADTDGNLYDESRRNRNLVAATKEMREKALRPGDWNDYRIRAEGAHIQLWLNGVKTVDFTESDETIPHHGIIAFQIHGGAYTKVQYRNFAIEELPAFGQTNAPAPQAKLEFIRIGKDGRHFVTAGSGLKFTPWGCNYDHDRSGRLLEQYWEAEWDTVAQDFAEMKTLGANTVRIHLQVAHFMKSAREPNQASLQRLGQLVAVAERTGLYLDVTGLGCYDKKEVPPWYNGLNEKQRWDVQARFWGAVAKTCHNSPAVFCYDLMNEPVVTEDKTNRDWTPGAFGGRYFVQRITLDFAGRTDRQIAKAWVDKLATAIRQQDSRHLITVGEIPWALFFPGAKPLFHSKEAGGKLDFVSVHFYPKKGEVDQALKALAVYDVGKPIVIEEMFPLNCPMEDLAQFIDRSKPVAAGWISFYWGETIAEYKQQKGTNSDAITASWLDYFSKKAPDILGLDAQAPAPGHH